MINRVRKGFLLLALLVTLCGCGAGEEEDTLTFGEPLNPEETVVDGMIVNRSDLGNNKHDNSVTNEDDRQGTVILTVSAAGDVTLGNHQNQEYGFSFREKYDQEGDAYFLQNVKTVFEEDDLTIVNFEGVLTESDEMRGGTYNMKGDPSYINILTEGCVEAVGFANNHQHDYLQQGIDDTVQCFEDAGLTYAYDDITGIYETQGIRIGIISVNEVELGAAVEPSLKENIEALKQETDLVIVCCHWGIEKEYYPEDYQKILGRNCVDWGADLVLGSHPHVLQGVEVYQGKFIVYSLANFCFGGNRGPEDKDTMIFQQDFTFVDGVKQEDRVARVIPCSISTVKSHNDFCPTPAVGEEYQRILGRINTFSENFGVRFDENGCYAE